MADEPADPATPTDPDAFTEWVAALPLDTDHSVADIVARAKFALGRGPMLALDDVLAAADDDPDDTTLFRAPRGLFDGHVLPPPQDGGDALFSPVVRYGSPAPDHPSAQPPQGPPPGSPRPQYPPQPSPPGYPPQPQPGYPPYPPPGYPPQPPPGYAPHTAPPPVPADQLNRGTGGAFQQAFQGHGPDLSNEQIERQRHAVPSPFFDPNGTMGAKNGILQSPGSGLLPTWDALTPVQRIEHFNSLPRWAQEMLWSQMTTRQRRKFGAQRMHRPWTQV